MNCENKNLNSGLALTLLSLLAFSLFRLEWLLHLTVILLVICMSVPALFRPFALIWFPLSDRLAKLFSSFFLSAVFILLVVPVALVRRTLGKDPLHLRSRPSGTESLFSDRQHCWSAADLENPY